MNKLRKGLAALVAAASIGCAHPQVGGHGGIDKRVYSGETVDYLVNAEEYYNGGTCNRRVITLRSKPRFRRQGTVNFVEATDYNCNNKIEKLRFRDPIEESRVNQDPLMGRFYLKESIIHAFYEAIMQSRRKDGVNKD